MPSVNRPRPTLLLWLLASVLTLSTALNAYLLLPGYQSARELAAASLSRREAEATAVDDDDDEDDDQVRARLVEELRRTRLQLAHCQTGEPAATAATNRQLTY